MDKTNQPDFNQLRRELQRLCETAGYEQRELIDFIEEAGRHQLAPERLQILQAENERLKLEVKRLRNQLYDKTASSMSSKLRDALRE